jgi:hypothetical protein
MKLSPSWGEAKSAATQEFPSILWNSKVHYQVHKSPHTGPCPDPDQSNPSHPLSLRSILILSTHLRLGLPSGLFLSGFPTNKHLRTLRDKLSISYDFGTFNFILLVTVSERSNACTVFARSEAGIEGSNPTQGMDVWCLCMCVFLCLCRGRGLATSWSPAQGVLPNV